MAKLRAATLAVHLTLSIAYPSFRLKVPNGHRLPCPDGMQGCNVGDQTKGEPESVCYGIGHKTCMGGTIPLNPFGDDFMEAGWQWTEALCKKDSDGDGQTNGEELGDPCCLWNKGDMLSPHMQSSFPSHPGVANDKRDSYTKPDCSSSEVQPSGKAPKVAGFQPGEVQKSVDFIVDSYEMPAVETTYVDFGFNFDDEEHSIYHIVYADALVDQPKHLHHFVVTGCTQKIPSSEVGKARRWGEHESCYQPLGGDLAGWAPGAIMFAQPFDSGVPIGKGVNIVGFNLNVHYTDANLAPGTISKDGFRVFYTPTLRPKTLYSVGIIAIGGNKQMSIPPGKKRHFLTRTCEVETAGPVDVNQLVAVKTGGLLKSCQEAKKEGHCADELGASACPDTCGKKEVGIPVVASFYHAHLLGSEMYATLKRGTEEIDLASQSIWHYNDQATFQLPTWNLTVQRGDVIQATCVFDSRMRTEATIFSQDTKTEMCFVMLSTEHHSMNVVRDGGIWCKDDGQTRGRLWMGELADNEDGREVAKLHPYLQAEYAWEPWDGGRIVKVNPGPLKFDFSGAAGSKDDFTGDASFKYQWGNLPEDALTCTSSTDVSDCRGCEFEPVCWTHETINDKHYCGEQAKTAACVGIEDGKKPAGEFHGIQCFQGLQQRYCGTYDRKPTDTTTESASTKKVVAIELTMKGLDYDKLKMDTSAMEELEKEVKASVLESLSSMYSDTDITVTFSKGSVKANVEITPKFFSTSAELSSSLSKKTDDIATVLLKSVKEMPNVATFLEDGKTLQDLELSSAAPAEVNAGSNLNVHTPANEITNAPGSNDAATTTTLATGAAAASRSSFPALTMASIALVFVKMYM